MVEKRMLYAIQNMFKTLFIFCPMIKSIEMDSIMAHGIFLSENEMSQMEEGKHSIFCKFSNFTFEEKDSLKSKCKILNLRSSSRQTVLGLSS